MGIFSGITDTLFGDGGEGAAEAQSQQNAADRKFIAEQADVARTQAMPLMAASERNKLLGQQAAINALSAAAPQQIGAFEQGGNNAMAAILGGQINPIQYSTDHLNVQLPDFVSIQETLGNEFQSPRGGYFDAPSTQDLYGGRSNFDILMGADDIKGLSAGAQAWLPKWGSEMMRDNPTLAGGMGFVNDPMGHLAASQRSGLADQNKAFAAELFNILKGA